MVNNEGEPFRGLAYVYRVKKGGVQYGFNFIANYDTKKEFLVIGPSEYKIEPEFLKCFDFNVVINEDETAYLKLIKIE